MKKLRYRLYGLLNSLSQRAPVAVQNVSSFISKFGQICNGPIISLVIRLYSPIWMNDDIFTLSFGHSKPCSLSRYLLVRLARLVLLPTNACSALLSSQTLFITYLSKIINCLRLESYLFLRQLARRQIHTYNQSRLQKKEKKR